MKENIVINKFNKILEDTEYGFHDAGLIELSYKPEDYILYIAIEHMVFKKEKNIEYVYISRFEFKNIKSLKMNFELEKDMPAYQYNEINDFSLKESKGEHIFQLEGIQGWFVIFTSDCFSYEEEQSTPLKD